MMGHNFFGKINNEGNDDINMFEGGIAFKPNETIREYLKKLDAYYLNNGIKIWIKCEDYLPDEDEVVLCYCPSNGNFVKGSIWMGSDFCLGERKGNYWKRVDNENIEVESWMRFPNPEKETPEWKQLGWCCENLCKSTSNPNSSIFLSDTNELFIMNIQERINLCPWCGEKIND